MARTIEEHLKQALGNLAFQVVMAQAQLEQTNESLEKAQAELKALQKEEPGN